jgi:hypothetical protein
LALKLRGQRLSHSQTLSALPQKSWATSGMALPPELHPTFDLGQSQLYQSLKFGAPDFLGDNPEDESNT